VKPLAALSNQEIFSRVVAILVREFDVSPTISMRTNLRSISISTASTVALASWVEEDLAWRSDDEIEQMRSVDQIVTVISARLRGEKAG
jgi:acyl carrier protein